MPVLDNHRHELFAQGLAKGVAASEAYTQAGYAFNDGNCIRLKGDDRVRQRVAELQSRAAQGVVMTRQKLIEMCLEAYATAKGLEKANPSAMVSAIAELGVLTGLRVERTDNEHRNSDISAVPMTPEAWEDAHAGPAAHH